MSNLEVHHKAFRSRFGDDCEQNLITLCSACHATTHHGSAVECGSSRHRIPRTRRDRRVDPWPGLRGLVNFGHTVMDGTSLLNLDGFAPANTAGNRCSSGIQTGGKNCSAAHYGWTGKPLGRYGAGIVAFTWFEKPLSTPDESTAVET